MSWARDVMALFGLALTALGVFQVWEPLGWCFAGLTLVVIAVAWSKAANDT